MVQQDELRRRDRERVVLELVRQREQHIEEQLQKRWFCVWGDLRAYVMWGA